MTRRKSRGTPVVNRYVEDDGKRYRIAVLGARPLLVALKLPTGGERLLKHDGQRFRRIVRTMRTRVQP